MDAAVAAGHAPGRRTLAVDATGLESRHRSKHYAWRLGKGYRARTWPKLAVAADAATHLLVSALVRRGPSQDAPLWLACLRPAARRVAVLRALGDAGFDAEANHAVARRRLGVGCTAIKLNPRRTGRRWPKGGYRRRMAACFPKVPYRQRVQVESCFSRLKRRLGSSLRARSPTTQRHEIYLRVLAYNFMLLAVY